MATYSASRPLHGMSSRMPIHPGRYLASHFLAPGNLTQGQLARMLGISRRRVNELLNGKRSITPDTAVRLASSFGTDPHLWITWQAAYDLHRTWRELRRSAFVQGAQ